MQASLFITCLADSLAPRVGESVVRLLHREGVSVRFPPGQTCCGQPAYNSGFQAAARAMADNFRRAFAGAEYIVTPAGSCAAMVRVYYPELYPEGTPAHREVLALADRTYEFSEFLVDVLGRVDLGATFSGRATYHRSCHMLRELGIREAPVELLKHVRNLEYVEMERTDLCCGFGGSFSVRMADLSVAMADEKLTHLAATGADLLVASDGGCLMQLAGRLDFLGRPVRTMHLAELLAVGCGLLPELATQGGGRA